MASTRLTNTVRDQIWERLENHAFRGRRESLRKALELLAEDAYKRLVGTLPGYGKAETLPKGWVVRLKDFRVRIAGQVEQMLLLDPGIFPEDQASRYSRPIVGSLEAADPLAARWEALQDCRRAIDSEVKKARNEAYAVLNKATTFAKLKSAWPELLPLCEDLLREVPTVKQDLVVTGNLNKNLCLPAEKK